MQTAAKTQIEAEIQPVHGEAPLQEVSLEELRDRQAKLLRLLWDARRDIIRAAAIALVASTLIAFLIPKSYTSTAQLMPPDTQSSSGLAMMAAMASKVGGGLGSVAGDLLGMKSSGALFIGVLRSQTSQERLIQEFRLQKVYGKKLVTDARTKLDENTSISEDRKSGIISIAVTDHKVVLHRYRGQRLGRDPYVATLVLGGHRFAAPEKGIAAQGCHDQHGSTLRACGASATHRREIRAAAG